MTTQHTPDQITKLQGRIAELEAQLYAIGAGGVGQSIKPQVQADTPQPTENLHCKSTQKRLATLWGYEKARQPLTEEHIYRLYSNAMRGYWVESFHHWKLKKRNEAREFARAVEAAHGIGGNHG